MKTILVAEATGPALDWLVAKCETPSGRDNADIWLRDYRRIGFSTRYSTSWAQGGPIIEREAIRLTPDSGATYVDCVWFAGSANEDGDEFNGEGPTPLIAAMRCYAASKLGDTAEVPEGLA